MKDVLAVVLVLLLPAGAAVAADPPRACGVFVLERDGGAPVVRRYEVAAGAVQVWPSDADSGTIDVILPPGRGGSGSLAQLGQPRLHVVRCADGQLQHQVRLADGKTVDFPARSLEDLARYDIRLSVVGGDGSRAAFLIAGYATVEPDAGPVQNLFAGTPLPLGNDDYILTTDTYLRGGGALESGVAAVELNGHVFARVRGADGKEGWFVVDLGAGETLVARGFLPEGTAVEQSAMEEYSSAGRRLLDYAPGGATGEVQGILGHVRLPLLQLGEIRLPEVTSAVIEELPDLFDRPVVGILGIDLLRRAGRVTLEFPPEARGAGRLRLDEAGPVSAGEGAVEVPFSMVNTHLLVPAAANGVALHLILDTGAPDSLLDEAAARDAGIEVVSAARELRGLGGQGMAYATGTIRELTLGGSRFTDVLCRVAPLTVFRPLRSDVQRMGLMGNAFLGRFGRVEIDFARRRVRFVERGADGKRTPPLEGRL